MDSDQGKLFIGGISWETTEEKLKEYFHGYGEVVQAVVMRDKISGKPRGFGFVVFSDPDILDRVLQDRHVIDGRTVEAKRALSREEQQGPRGGNSGGARSFGGGNNKTKKIFVGGLPPTLNEDGFRQYFEAYGVVTDVVIMYDQQTNRPRGFGFISFDSEDAVDRVLHKTFHDLNGKQVEVKRAQPKDSNPGGGGGRSMGGSFGGGAYQGYASSGGNSNSYDSRMESNRYMQSQHSGGGYPPFGSSGYNAPGYGYGPTNNTMGYGYGNYGGNNLSAGYGGQRNSWGSQGSSGYGYGGSQWGGTGTGTGQSPGGGVSGYANQGYGYGGYGGNEGGYGNQAGYGAVGGRPAAAPNGGSADHAAGAYGDGSGYGGNPGYHSGWQSDASQASGNYGLEMILCREGLEKLSAQTKHRA
ncbi:Heterogeneous nuclear ribonucleoprotein 1 [Striga hermonthica]|uniref:Heterogeneous nuclear ribonucleoprotein 1 n=1 Tax=Striga hermonthica TaxID=68872 RepID=A0A9N7N369_STRHE|nr:Heterogeneous nuclear ribonucleoprotein 1 [Striga hermonthica]